MDPHMQILDDEEKQAGTITTTTLWGKVQS